MLRPGNGVTFQKLDDYPFKGVEEVRLHQRIIGLLEAQGGPHYKSFSGAGFECRYLSAHASREAAIKALLEANETL